MKRVKRGRVLSALLLFSLLINIALPSAAAAEAPAPLKWEKIDKPGPNGEIILSPSDINRMVASHDVVYVVDTNNGKLHRSNNGGLTFNDITSTLRSYGAQMPAHEIAVAPDRPQYVAVSDNLSRIFLSDDSGATWNNSALPILSDNTTIQCMSISTGYRSGSVLMHDIAVGTADWGDSDNITSGQIYTLQIGASFASWKNQSLAIKGASGVEVSAIAFSPKYSSDKTILAIGSTANDTVAGSENCTYLCFGQKKDLLDPASTIDWNLPPDASVYPLLIASAGDQGGVRRIISRIAVPSDYDGRDMTTRKVIISYDRQPDIMNYQDDAYKIDDNLSPRLIHLNVKGGGFVNISSIALSDNGTWQTGKLLVGEADPVTPLALRQVQVWRTLNPFDTSGSISWNKAYQPPSGPGNALVAWSHSGSVAFCGTGRLPGAPLDESAFSQSLDNGNHWEQTSLIDTNIHITDIAPAPDSRSLFMATYSDFGPEGVWRSAGEPLGRYWGRMLTMRSTTNRVVLRLSPDYSTDYTIYAVEVNRNRTVRVNDNQAFYAGMLCVSQTRGNYWTKRIVPWPVVDVAVESKGTLYIALFNGCIRKSTDGGLVWGEPVNTGLTEINMLAITKNRHILAGSRDGEVAYSTDGGASFQVIPVPLGRGFGDVQVEADARYAANNLVYAAAAYSFVSDNLTITDNLTNIAQGIWRWTIGQSTQWEQIDEVITNTGSPETSGGLKAGSEGTLYALRLEPAVSDSRTGLRQPVVTGDNTTGITQFVLISDNGTGGMSRTLNPTDPVSNIEFDILNRTLPAGTTFDLCQLLNSAISDNFSAYLPNHLAQLKISGNASQNDLWAVGADNLSSDITYIYRFQDNVCKVGPLGVSPAEVGCDPVSGRNQQVDLKWEQLSVSDEYELRLAKDSAFTLRLGAAEPVSNPYYMPAVVTSPAYWVSPGIQGMECGRAYYWQVRTRHAATTEFIRSPWSVARSYDVKPGFPVTTPYLGPQLLTPENGCRCSYDPPFCFSWTPYKGATKYKFELSEHADMSDPLISWNVTTTAYQYNGELKRDAGYFWRVMEIEPVPGDWSAVFTFSTSPLPMLPFLPAKVASVPLWAWTVLAIGSIASIILIACIIRRWREPC